MDLIERYLAAVGRNLPTQQAADIEAELRDLLLSRIEEQESDRGRPLDTAELEALLIAFGHPLAVAGRYRQTQYLIGPEIFPFWWAAMKVTLGIVSAAFVIMAVLGLAAQSSGPDFGRLIPPLWSSLCITFAVVTLTAVAVEQQGLSRYLKTWRPARLPPPHPKTRSAFERTMEIGASVIAVLWWMGLIRFSDWIPDWSALQLRMAPVWQAYHGWILSYLLAEIALSVLALARPAQARIHHALAIARYVYGAVILAGVLQAGHFVVVSSAEIAPLALAIIQRNFDKGFYAGIIATIAVMLVQAAVEAWRIWRGEERRA